MGGLQRFAVIFERNGGFGALLKGFCSSFPPVSDNTRCADSENPEFRHFYQIQPYSCRRPVIGASMH